jgi:hypothetical protein
VLAGESLSDVGSGRLVDPAHGHSASRGLRPRPPKLGGAIGHRGPRDFGHAASCPILTQNGAASDVPIRFFPEAPRDRSWGALSGHPLAFDQLITRKFLSFGLSSWAYHAWPPRGALSPGRANFATGRCSVPIECPTRLHPDSQRARGGNGPRVSSHQRSTEVRRRPTRRRGLSQALCRNAPSWGNLGNPCHSRGLQSPLGAPRLAEATGRDTLPHSAGRVRDQKVQSAEPGATADRVRIGGSQREA